MDSLATQGDEQGGPRQAIFYAVVDALAEHEGVDQMDLEPRLCTVIDPEALDALFAPVGEWTRRTPGHVSFAYNGYEVRVSSEGRVRIFDPDDGPTA